MKKVINQKPIKADCYINKCSCGKKVKLKRCVWLDEAESVCNIFTLQAHRLGTNKLEPKYKMRKFYLGVCSCEKLYYLKLK